MKTSRLEKIYVALLLVIFGGIVLHAPLSVGLGTLFPDYALLIKSWKEIILLALIPVAATIVTKRRLWRELLNDWIFRIVIAYAALHIITALISFQGATATMAGLAIDLRYILFFTLVYVAIRALPQYSKWFLRVGIIGASIVVGFATIQLFLPPDFLKIIGYGRDTIVPYLTVDQNPDYIRYSSTLRGPNPLGAYAVMALAFLTVLWARGMVKWELKRFTITVWLLTICAVIALWVSYSRSSLVGGIVAVVLAFIVAVGWKFPRRSWIAAVAMIIALLCVLFAARGTEFVSNVILHENQNGGSSVSSNDGHVSSLQTGVNQMIRQPFGGGIGSTGSASLYGDSPIIIENQYLSIAHETGWLGLGIFLALFTLIMQRLWQKRQDWLSLGVFASGVGIALIGLLLPVWVDDAVSIIWWGLAALALAGGKNGKAAK